jgi:arylsulfatase A-like enzyme
MKDAEQPFYCFASFPDPHWPVMPPKPFFEMYDGVEIPDVTPYNGEAEKDNYPQQFKALRYENRKGYDGGGHYVKDLTDIKTITRAYWGAVSLIDKNVGKMLDKLDELGMADDTIIVFTSDHGEYMGSHGLMAKGGCLYEELINIPFLIKNPASSYKGVCSDALLSFVDVVPTLLEAVGITQHGLSLDGVSQWPVVNGEKESIRERLTLLHAGRDRQLSPDQHVLITEEWKLVYVAGDPNGELYNLKNDPQELNNLYNRAEFAGIQQRLTLQLMDEMILQMDMEPVAIQQTAGKFGVHHMSYGVWKEEFDRLERQTGKA